VPRGAGSAFHWRGWTGGRRRRGGRHRRRCALWRAGVCRHDLGPHVVPWLVPRQRLNQRLHDRVGEPKELPGRPHGVSTQTSAAARQWPYQGSADTRRAPAVGNERVRPRIGCCAEKAGLRGAVLVSGAGQQRGRRTGVRAEPSQTRGRSVPWVSCREAPRQVTDATQAHTHTHTYIHTRAYTYTEDGAGMGAALEDLHREHVATVRLGRAIADRVRVPVHALRRHHGQSGARGSAGRGRGRATKSACLTDQVVAPVPRLVRLGVDVPKRVHGGGDARERQGQVHFGGNLPRTQTGPSPPPA
jgi:hypothetical protein